MVRRWMVLALLGITICPAVSMGNSSARMRQQIRSMPITERPNRPGHIYGNSVRRAVHRKGP